MTKYSIRTLLAVLSICATSVSSAGQAAAEAPKAKVVTAVDLRSLRWIEGTWRGTGAGQGPFFERYKLEGGKTLVVETLEDGKVTSTSRYELTGGELAGGTGASRRVATALDRNSVTFSFVATNRGWFRWERVTADSWKATLAWPQSGSRSAGERVYTMERVR